MKNVFYLVFLFVGLSSAVAQDTALKLSLNDAIDYAIKNNYDNKVAAKNIEAAKEKKWETTTIGLPQINGKADYQSWIKQQVQLIDLNGDGIDEELAFGQKQSFDASVTLSQLLFDGSYIVGLQSAKTYLKISEQAKEKTELATREAVINAYGNVLVAEKSIEIFERNKEVLTKNLNETQKIYENGLTELENVEQLQITLGTLENNLRNAQRLREIAYQMLNISLGNPINKNLELTDTLESLTTENTDLSLLTKTFNINEHIDYQIAENDREAKRLLMKLEKSKALPTLSAFVNYGAIAYSDSFTFLKSEQRWLDYSLLGVSLNIPIFSSLGRTSKTAQAKIELENADIRLDETKQKLNLQAKTAKSEYQLSIENYETAKKNLALAERIEKKQEIKFFEGISSSFDLLQAQNQLYSQQNNYVQSMLNVIAKKAKLESALNLPIK
ncbi:TolC family protein [Tenacibaculum sp. IB213877]|uniref:TolC family protein n=1 Tax=Tenacibaculum sp. IB213877 TaxID=3097351 RepID=UPI002A5A5E34|nr:TolC family protein [Tenacibaculum sp. IB213877]MDY0780957.1 TolC family protein [Tenacibaculum sp. IB213877]